MEWTWAFYPDQVNERQTRQQFRMRGVLKVAGDPVVALWRATSSHWATSVTFQPPWTTATTD
jgi:hypothetical protein